MSFILDALKKSELERQRQATPGLVEVPTAQRRRGLPLWAWIVGAVLLVNVGVLALLLWRSQRPATAPVAATATPAPVVPARAAAPPAASPRAVEAPAAMASGTVAREQPEEAAPAAAPPAEHFSPMDTAPAGAPVYAPEIRVDEPTPRATAPAPRTVAPLVAGGAARTPRRADPTLNEAPAEPVENDEMLPTLSEVNIQNAPGLADIHLDVHVFATRPADRFVYVNMRKYREGSTLQEGPLLERIRRDGVVLNYRGVRFLLPRQ